MKDFKKHFWRVGEISFPLTLATASGTILVLIDSFFATRISIETYEAVFLALPILGLSTAIGIGLSAALADLISKEKDLVHIKRLITSSFIFAFLSIVSFLGLVLFFPHLIEQTAGIHQLEEGSKIASEFRDYWKIILWTFPLQIIFSMMMQFLTILEYQKKGMYIIISNIILNIILDYFFTQHLSLGIKGLAFSTMTVFSTGVLLSCIPLIKEKYFQSPYPTIFNRLFLKAFWNMSITTFLIFISVGIFSVSAILMNQIALSISTSALVIFAVYRQIMQIFIISTRGFAGGFIIYIGNALRDKNTADYFPIYWAATAWMAIFNIAAAILVITIPKKLIGLFDNVDSTLFPEIIYFLFIGAIIMLIHILPRMATTGFISLNKGIFLVINSFLFVIIQLISAIYWLESFGINSLIYSELLASTVTLIIFLPLFFYFLKKAKAD